jgi:hypothetical protein
MNSIAWVIYWASFSDKINGIVGFWGILMSICVVATLACMVISKCIETSNVDSENKWNQSTEKSAKLFYTTSRGWFRFCISVALVCGTIYSFVPAKDTLYAMAASELVEQSVQNPNIKELGSDTLKALDYWVKKQITPDEPHEKK